MLSRRATFLYSSSSSSSSSSVLRILLSTSRPSSRDFFWRSPSKFFSSSRPCCAPRQEAQQQIVRRNQLQTFKNWEDHLRLAPIYESQFDYTYLLVAFTITIIGSAVITYTTSGSPDHNERKDTEGRATLLEDNMVALSGRPGNLTQEEEVNLKQFWRMIFNVVGVDTGGTPSLPDSASAVNGDVSSVTGDKQRKSGFFARRRTESKPATEEDKYGQTKEYQEALATTSPEEFRRAFWSNSKNEHPDAVALRFLRARKWDLQKALVMMISTLQWRAKVMKIEEEIVSKGELSALQDEKGDNPALSKEGGDFLSQLRKGKSYVHGVDREGRPVTWVRVRLHHGGEQSDTSIERFTVQTFETTRLLIDPPADTGVCQNLWQNLSLTIDRISSSICQGLE